ncbi:fasciclin-like arabinogalactan protein 3 [Lycium ferocissimum]|uniref:fasciclin-like arabinogalactan protein 3 n=1 Tax=Lycium ferocissimum TaxID=112874 RepID=UPI0028156A7D|nr:fasciclin-like arabinogalactan protein 3 [Lycium ferocissimum]
MKAPTLFQTTGQANNDQGFLNVTDLGSGSIYLGSAAKGATLGSNLVKSIASQPFNISILQISNVIIPLGIDSSTSSGPSSSPTRAPAPGPESKNSPAPSPTPISGAPTPSLAPSPNIPSAALASGSGSAHRAVTTDREATRSAPHGPDGSSPKADAPTAETPAGASVDAPATEDHHDSPSASAVLGVSLVFLAMSNLFLVLVI